jgi:hypothetical protein
VLFVGYCLRNGCVVVGRGGVYHDDDDGDDGDDDDDWPAMSAIAVAMIQRADPCFRRFSATPGASA